METTLGLIVGIGLSAACGFRVFVPLLGMSIAAHSGYVTLAPGFEWLGTREALIAFSAATVIEIAAYYIPWVDNTLDALTTPLAVVAGTILTASCSATFLSFSNGQWPSSQAAVLLRSSWEAPWRCVLLHPEQRAGWRTFWSPPSNLSVR
jgi:hypothetical protein